MIISYSTPGLQPEPELKLEPKPEPEPKRGPESDPEQLPDWLPPLIWIAVQRRRHFCRRSVGTVRNPGLLAQDD